MPPPNTSDLIFSEQANHNFSRTLGELKRSTLSIHNRLNSIQHDAAFVQEVLDAYKKPLVANERCGSWYIDPSFKGGSAYFKSTDGHTGVWKFSSRRLNLHLLDIIGKNDGCIIIDSTRRGKRMPDALSKTIPIWCSVLNRLLFPDDIQCHKLYTPPQVVSPSEHAQITALLPSFLSALQDLKVALPDLQSLISKPLRPIWVTPETNLAPNSSIFDNFHPVICCTVSRVVAGGELSEGGYIQGAGDDTENWAHGLTPPVFWSNKQLLLDTPESELPDLIEMLVEQKATNGDAGTDMVRCIKPTSYLFVTTIEAAAAKETRDDACMIVLLPKVTPESTWKTSSSRLDVGVGPQKVGMRNLRNVLPFILEFVDKVFYPEEDKISEESDVKQKHIMLACESGKDLSIGVALAILCLYFDDQGELRDKISEKVKIDKSFIRGRLSWVSTSMPDVNPNRATLQSVNSYLMDASRLLDR